MAKRERDKTLSDKIIAAYKLFAYVILGLMYVCMCGMLSFSFPRVLGLVIIITFFIVVLRLLLLLLFLSSLESDRSRNSSGSSSSTHCRQQKTTFPYTSIEMAGWLAGWLCSGQRLNVTAIKTKWHWNTHKNFNQLFMQNNRCLNRFKLIKKSEGGFERAHAHTNKTKSFANLWKSVPFWWDLSLNLLQCEKFLFSSSTASVCIFLKRKLKASTKWQKNSLSSLWQQQRREKNNKTTTTTTIWEHWIFYAVLNRCFGFGFCSKRDALCEVSKNGVRKSGVY